MSLYHLFRSWLKPASSGVRFIGERSASSRQPMSTTRTDREPVRQLVTDTILGPDFRRATFGGAARRQGPSPWVRVAIRPVELRGERYLQFSYFDVKKNITKNFRGREIAPRLDEILDLC